MIQIDESLFEARKPFIGSAAKLANQRLREGRTSASEYSDIRQALSRGFEAAVEEWRDSLDGKRWWDLSVEGVGVSGGYFNSLKKSRKVVEKTKLLTTEERKAGLAMLDAYAEVSEALDHLKTLVKKREVLTADEKTKRQTERLAPTTPFEKRIFDAVMALRPGIEAELRSSYTLAFARMLQAYDQVGLPRMTRGWLYLLSSRPGGYKAGGHPVWPSNPRPGESYQEWSARIRAWEIDPFSKEVSAAVGLRVRDGEPLPPKAAYFWSAYRGSLDLFDDISTEDGYLSEQKLESLVTSQSLKICNSIIAKLRHKVAILNEPVMQAGSDWGSFLLTGELNGQRIEIEQTTKFSTSVLGRPFFQFPALIYVGGKMMPEKKFLVWSGAAEAPKDAVL